MTCLCFVREPARYVAGQGNCFVMMSLEEYESLEETAYLLKSPKNARRLLESIAELESGQGVEQELVD